MTDAPMPSSVTDPPVRNAIAEYFAHWFDRVDQARSSQPHWMTPLVTATPRLEQEVRADVYLVQLGNGASVTSYGNGKGLERHQWLSAIHEPSLDHLSPTIAVGKGWGTFDIEATLTGNVPTAHLHTIGKSVADDAAFQYHLLKYLWPEVEVN